MDLKCPVSTQIPGRRVIVSTGQLHDSLGEEMIADDAAGHATVSVRISKCSVVARQGTHASSLYQTE